MGSVLVFILVCMTLCSFLFCNYLEQEERAGCFAFIVFRMSCYCKCPVALPRGVVGWSAVCDFDISLSHLLVYYSLA